MAQLNQNMNLSTFRMKKMKKGIQAPGKSPLAVLPQTLRKKASNLPSVPATGLTPSLPKAKGMSTPMGIMGVGMKNPKAAKYPS